MQVAQRFVCAAMLLVLTWGIIMRLVSHQRAGDGICFVTSVLLFAVTHCDYSVVGLCFEMQASFLR